MFLRTGGPTRALTCAIALASLTACATNPVTGKPMLSLVSEQQEIEMGRQAAQEAEQSIGLVNDPALQAYVQKVGAELAASSERPELPWTFKVVDDPSPNAFALPGGFIFVTRGMMDLMTNESQLATVVGHEIGHVTARHTVTQVSRAQLAQLGLGLGSIFVPAVGQLSGALGEGLNLLFLHYTRDAERQADELGFRYAEQRGYDVREMAKVFEALQRLEGESQQSSLPDWLATHPGEPERIQNAEARVAALPTPPDTTRLGRAVYMQHIDGLVFGENPRNGFFRGSTFYQPDLRIRVDFPQGWQTQNLSQAVMALSPQQDAMIQLTLAQGSAQSAAQGFFTQQGVQSGQVSSTTVNGLPTVVGQFQAQTQNGVVQGTAAFVEYGGRSYQILGYGPAGSYANQDAAVRRTIASFGPVTDPQILNVKPNRISIVRTDRTMTLAAFNQRYPSVVSIDELARTNQLDGAGSTIPAGTPVKRVIAG
jgi:predicted Zn-dependent protease